MIQDTQTEVLKYGLNYFTLVSYFAHKSILKIHFRSVCIVKELLLNLFIKENKNPFEMQRITLLKFTYLVSLGISFHIQQQLLDDRNN